MHVTISAFSLVHRMFYFCTLFSFYELLHICNTCCIAFRYLGMCNNSSARPKLMYLNSFMCWYKTTFSDKNIYFVNRKLKHSPIKEEFSHTSKLILHSYKVLTFLVRIGFHMIRDHNNVNSLLTNQRNSTYFKGVSILTFWYVVSFKKVSFYIFWSLEKGD